MNIEEQSGESIVGSIIGLLIIILITWWGYNTFSSQIHGWRFSKLQLVNYLALGILTQKMIA